MIFEFGKILILIGIFLIFLGALLILGSKTIFLGKLPGDIYIKKENFTFYFPITSCVLISIILSIIFYIIFRIFK